VAGDPDVTSRSVYVTGLPYETNEEEVTSHFSSQGDEVIKSTILRQNRRGIIRSMGCGIVEFASHDIALKAIEQFNDTELGGRHIKCREDRNPDLADDVHQDESHDATITPSKPNARIKKDRVVVADESRELDHQKVFVANIPWNTTKEDLVALFGTVGPVVAAEVLSTKKGRAMGSGIVEFVEAKSATAAINQLSGKELSGRAIIVRSCYK
jgi:RNA recognition motif-containing protein